MTSTVVFDVTQTEWTSDLYPFPMLLMIAIGAIMIGMNVSRKRRGLPAHSWRSHSDKPATILPFFVLGFGLITTILNFKNSYFDYHELRSAYEQGKCEIVEGKIENFHPGEKKKGATRESFDLGYKHFFYPSSGNNAAFKTTAVNGGPMKEGLHVRVHYCDRDIARLEILDSVTPGNE